MYKLIFIFALSAILTSCGGEEGQGEDEPQFDIVETAIPGVYFEIPEGALPKGLDLADIRIEPTSPPADITESVDDKMFKAWKLLPDGTQFEKPVRIVVPVEDVLPSFLHISNGEREWVTDVVFGISPQGHTASVSLEHFSDLVVFMGSRWQQAFEFSSAVPDTQVGELVDASLTVSMADFFISKVDKEEAEAWTNATGEFFPTTTQVYVKPGSKKYCGSRSARQAQLLNINENTNPCSVSTESNILEPKDIEAFRDQANIQPHVQSFKDQFTLAFGGYRCTDVGPAMIEFYFTVEWEGLTKTAREFNEPDPLHEIFSIRVEVPVNCVERTAVALLELQQSADVNAYGLRAANLEEVNETDESDFHWSAWDGGPGSHVRRRSIEGNTEETRYPWENQPTEIPGKFVLSEAEVELPLGLDVQANITTRTISTGSIMEVDGNILLTVEGLASVDRKKWSVLAGAGAEFSMTVAIREPSVVKITNCVLFKHSMYQQFADYQYSDESCSFKVEGASTLELPAVGKLQGISLPRTTEALGGQIIFFSMRENQSEEEPLNEDFGIYIRPESSFWDGVGKNGSTGFGAQTVRF